MTDWIKGTGKIVYDPYRGPMKNKIKWWCVIEIDKEITRYYRWWIQRRYHVKGLHPPAWDAHISIIRGETPAPELQQLWKKYHGQTVDFEYQHNPHIAPKRAHREDGEGRFWLVDVKCQLGTNIRDEFQFKSDWLFHITVGRTYFE